LDNLANDLEYCIAYSGVEVCSPLEWGEILSSKIDNIAVSGNICIGTKLSLYRFLLLRLLRLRALRLNNMVVVWGVIAGRDVLNCREIILVNLSDNDWLKLYARKLPRLLALPLSEPLRVLVFMFIGISGIPINLTSAQAIYALLAKYGYIASPIASTTGFETSVLWNFILHEKITFKGTGLEKHLKSVLTRLVKYHLASIGSWITQVTMATLLPLLLRTPFWLAQLVGIILGFAVNFILGYIYTWSMHRVKRVW